MRHLFQERRGSFSRRADLAQSLQSEQPPRFGVHPLARPQASSPFNRSIRIGTASVRPSICQREKAALSLAVPVKGCSDFSKAVMAGRADTVMEKMKQAKHPFPDRHRACEGAGHLFLIPNLPMTVTHLSDPGGNFDLDLGGGPEQTAVAAADAWARIVEFLRTTFGE